jgi:hypothetical protein
MNLVVIYAVAFILNIPFGFYRERYAKFSLMWFLMIHAPIPLVVAMRFIFGVDLTIETFSVSLVSAVAGQLVGSRIIRKFVTDRVN